MPVVYLDLSMNFLVCLLGGWVRVRMENGERIELGVHQK